MCRKWDTLGTCPLATAHRATSPPQVRTTASTTPTPSQDRRTLAVCSGRMTADRSLDERTDVDGSEPLPL